MGLLSDLKMYGRFAWGLRSFLRHTLTLEEAKAIIKKRMEERESNFLRIVKRGIFGYLKSPYLPLMKLAQCEMGDIENMVREKGLENTLMELRNVGIYISFEEFKGRKPIERKGKVIPTQAHDFDNPFLSHYYQAETGGTTGAGTRVGMDLDHISSQAPFIMIREYAHGLLNVPTAIWRGILPDESGFSSILYRYRSGNLPKKWFTPITKQNFKPSLKNHLATKYILGMGHLMGVPIPWPEPVHLDQAIVIARWAARTLESHGACLINTHVSMALRIALAAQEEKLNLTGVTFMGGGEPPTPAKVRKITSTGARYIPNYYLADVGIIGAGCANPLEINDLHFFKDGLSLIQYPRSVIGSEIKVDAFYLTTLLPTSPKIMLNVESDDYGIIETRACGCPLEGYGYTEHIRQVRSFQKLTGDGVTLVGSEMIHILEEILPGRFGGSPLDYQLVEEEDERGLTRLTLLVSPKIEISDEREVIETVLEALGQMSVSGNLARSIWSQAKALRIKRTEPIWTTRGKLMPLHLERSIKKEGL